MFFSWIFGNFCLLSDYLDIRKKIWNSIWRFTQQTKIHVNYFFNKKSPSKRSSHELLRKSFKWSFKWQQLWNGKILFCFEVVWQIESFYSLCNCSLMLLSPSSSHLPLSTLSIEFEVAKKPSPLNNKLLLSFSLPPEGQSRQSYEHLRHPNTRVHFNTNFSPLCSCALLLLSPSPSHSKSL